MNSLRTCARAISPFFSRTHSKLVETLHRPRTPLARALATRISETPGGTPHISKAHGMERGVGGGGGGGAEGEESENCGVKRKKKRTVKGVRGKKAREREREREREKDDGYVPVARSWEEDGRNGARGKKPRERGNGRGVGVGSQDDRWMPLHSVAERMRREVPVCLRVCVWGGLLACF